MHLAWGPVRTPSFVRQSDSKSGLPETGIGRG